jgi:hypothetical protein
MFGPDEPTDTQEQLVDDESGDTSIEDSTQLPVDDEPMVLEPDHSEPVVLIETESTTIYHDEPVLEVEESIDEDSSVKQSGESEREIFTTAPNVTLTYKTTEPFKNNFRPGPDGSLTLLSVSMSELEKMGENRPLGLAGNDEKTITWARAVAEGSRHVAAGDGLRPSTSREDSHWRQNVKSESLELQAGRPRVGEDSGGDKLTGLAAKMRMQAILGAGSPIRIPLWHTGIWVVLNTPSEGSLLELDRRIGSEKIILGRSTNGMIFSNSSVYTTSMLINAILSHVHDATVRFSDPMELKKIIKITDIPTLIWGFMVSVYPGGYPYQQPCTFDPGVCTHVIEELLNLHKLQWTDDRALTESQRKLMQRRNSKFTPEELAKYEQEHRYHQHSSTKLHPLLSMDLKVPTIEEYEQIGFQWVDDMVRAVDRSVSGALKEDERNQHIIEQAQTSYLHQYSHWVKRLTIHSDKGTEVIDDRESLNDSITVLVGKEDISNAYIEAVGKFINDSTISLIALPKVNCPACGKPMSADEKAHPHLVPFDVMSSFFTVQSQLTSKVLSRSTM